MSWFGAVLLSELALLLFGVNPARDVSPLGVGRGWAAALMGCLQDGRDDEEDTWQRLPPRPSAVPPGRAGAAVGRCSFRFANEKLGEERREGTCSGTYLATCPTSLGEGRGARAGSVALSREVSAGTVCGAGGGEDSALGDSTEGMGPAVPHGVHHIRLKQYSA